MKKLITLLTLLVSPIVFAQKIVNLESKVYENLIMDNDTIYVGTLPTERIEELKQKIIKEGKIPKNIIDKKYTTLSGQVNWGDNTEVRNTQFHNLESLGYLGIGNAVRNSVIYSDIPNGLETNNSTIEFTNNIFSGFTDSGLIINDTGYGGHNITDNLFCWNNIGLRVQEKANIGDEQQEGRNIFYKNDLNVVISGNVPSTPTRLEGNWWYDSYGTFLDTEENILKTIKANTPELSAKRKGMNSDLVDVVPFKTEEYVKSGPILGQPRVHGTPVLNPYGLSLLAGAMACAGAYGLRRKK